MAVIVLGSINIDLITKVTRLPLAGETIHGSAFFTSPGGKGANQAVAAAKLGAPTYMIGRVGADNFGQELITNLQIAQVDTTKVSIDATISSGIATILVGDRGENQIAIVAGANGNVGENELKSLAELLPQASSLLLQLEIPLPTVLQAAQMAHQQGVRVILDPAPVNLNLPPEIYNCIDIVTPNEIEASQLTNLIVDNIEAGKRAAAVLRQKGVQTAIVKLGDQGVVCATNDEIFHIPAFPVPAIDTVAAGDAFNGGLAAALDRNLSLKEAIAWGTATGALSTTKSGAQSAMPNLETLQAFLQEQL